MVSILTTDGHLKPFIELQDFDEYDKCLITELESLLQRLSEICDQV